MIKDIVIDCADPQHLTEFWCAATGYVYRATVGTFVVLSPPERDGHAPSLLLQRVEEPKVGKNRVHIDLDCDDLEATIARLLEMGATRGSLHEEFGLRWVVMHDPEGNEFCLSG